MTSMDDWRRKQRRRNLLEVIVNNSLRVAIVIGVLALWELAVREQWVALFSVSRPSIVWADFTNLLRDGVLGTAILATLKEAAVGYVLGVAVGVSAGFGLAQIRRVGAIFEPFITMLNSLPRIALAPLMLIWFGIGSGSRIALVFSLVVFVLLVNTLEGARNLDRDIVTVSRLLGASRLQLLTKVVLPATFPWIIAGMRLSIAYALGAAVVGEMYAGQDGIGYLMAAGTGFLNTGQVFVGLVIIMLLAYVIDLGGKALGNRLLRWRPEVPIG